MYIATLLTAPSLRNLDPVLVEALRSAWGGTEAVWLAPGEAAEFALGHIPENRWNVWQDLQEQGVDLAVIPAQNRRKRMLLADMDSTMIEQECIDELADEAGIGSKVKDITARAMNGELDFEEALKARVGLLAGLPVTTIEKVLNERITYMPGGDVLLATMKANGAYAALVSGGFTDFTKAVAAKLGFDEDRANTLLSEGSILSGTVGMPILGKQAKVDALQEITMRLGFSDKEVLAVGDGANDLGMLKQAGMGVALHAKSTVAAQCDLRINHGDLTALLYLQGYPKSDFVAA
ncbi:MAG: phosphoserine phosphatase SerB [Paracoccaceae bacterium]|nr:phosphoserine phosphatase SerB [Paracoccaceae bacterium]